MSYRFNYWRVLLSLAAVVGVLYAPWWVPAALVLALCVRFRAWEVILIGMFADLFWMPTFVGASFESLPLSTIYALVILFIFEPLRRQLLIGDRFS
jgi:hypothetical protein